jgi:acyl carrier protein
MQPRPLARLSGRPLNKKRYAVSEDLREKLRSIIADVSEVDEIPDDTPFKDLGIDSMMAIEIVAEVERTYKLTIPEDELQDLTSFNKVYAKVQQKLADANAAE